MNKTILALMISSAAMSVNAAEVYKDNRTTVEIDGKIQTLLHKSKVKHSDWDKKENDGILKPPLISTVELRDKKYKDYTKAELRELGHPIRNPVYATHTQGFDLDPSAELTFKASHDLNASFTINGEFKLKAKSNSYYGAVEFDDIMMGLEGDFGQLTLGQTDSSFEILEKARMDNELKNFDVFADTHENRGVRYEGKIGLLDASVDYQTHKEETAQNTYAASLGYEIDNVTVAVAYAKTNSFKSEDKNNSFEGKAFGLASDLVIGNLTLGATVTKFYDQDIAEFDNGNDFEIIANKDKDGYKGKQSMSGMTYALGASYSMSKFTAYGGYEMLQIDKIGDLLIDSTNVQNVYVGGQYDFDDSLKAFAETAIVDAERYGNAMDLVVGAEYNF